MDCWSGAHYWPCEVQVKSGAWVDRVCIIRGVDCRQGGLLPSVVHVFPEDITSLRESPNRLPPPYIKQSCGRGRSAARNNGAVLEIVFDDTSTLVVGGDASFEFPAYPMGKSALNVVGIRQPAGEWSGRVTFPHAPIWCLIL